MEIACGGILYINASCFRRRVLSGPSSLSEPFGGGIKTGSGGGAEEVVGLDGVVLKGSAILHLQFQFTVTLFHEHYSSHNLYFLILFALYFSCSPYALKLPRISPGILFFVCV